MRKIEPMTITEEQAEWLQQYIEKPSENPRAKEVRKKLKNYLKQKEGE
ncbi:hypothetical protein QUF96_03210 [Bacillus bombysepticus]|nr:hypothetical protein [Bacillus bombysepticus]